MMGLMTEGNLGEGDRKWSDLWSTNSMKNPFVYRYMSRGAPGTRAVGAIGESLLGVALLVVGLLAIVAASAVFLSGAIDVEPKVLLTSYDGVAWINVGFRD